MLFQSSCTYYSLPVLITSKYSTRAAQIIESAIRLIIPVATMSTPVWADGPWPLIVTLPKPKTW
jgi:hypothetical protein